MFEWRFLLHFFKSVPSFPICSLPRDQDCHEMWLKKRRKMLRDSRHAAHHAVSEQVESHARQPAHPPPQPPPPQVEEGELAGADVNGRREDKDTGDLRDTIAQLVEIIRSRPEGMDTNQLLSLMQVGLIRSASCVCVTPHTLSPRLFRFKLTTRPTPKSSKR